MPLKLFGYSPKRIVADSIGCGSSYRHSFGGSATDFGFVFPGLPKAMHLIYCIDLTDPCIPLSRTDIELLPLFFPFDYDMRCSYSIRNGKEIVVHGELGTPSEPPTKPLRQHNTSFRTEDYDPTNWHDAFAYKGVFGWDELAEKNRKKAVNYAVKTYGITKEEYAPDPEWELEDIVRCMFSPPFAQLTAPYNDCKNPSCVNEDLVVLGLLYECHNELEQIWGTDPYSQTIWQMCPECGSITVSNQCD